MNDDDDDDDDHDDKFKPGLHDPISVPLDERIQRYEAYLNNSISYELAVKIAATYSILARDTLNVLATVRVELEQYQKQSKEVVEVAAHAIIGLKIGAINSEKLAVVLGEKIERRKKLSGAGKKGVAVRADKLAPLKNWAIQEAKNLKGKPPEKARNLMKKIEPTLASLANDPERVMREAIRAFEKNT
jgi:esterase/lipase